MPRMSYICTSVRFKKFHPSRQLNKQGNEDNILHSNQEIAPSFMELDRSLLQS
jgi:hypothetical protein